MRRTLLLALALATLAVSLAASPSSAAPGQDRHERATPDPAWSYGIEWGLWEGFSGANYTVPDAGRLGLSFEHAPLFEVSAMRMWRPIAMRVSLSRAEFDFSVYDVIGGGNPPLGTATCGQLRVSALLPLWSLRRPDDRRPGRTQWSLGYLTGPTVSWTRFSDLQATAEGVEYAGIDRLSVRSGLQVGWEVWFGGPLWSDGPLAHVLLYLDMAVVGFGRDLLEYRTTPASSFVSGGSRVSPATFKVGLAYLRNLGSRNP